MATLVALAIAACDKPADNAFALSGSTMGTSYSVRGVASVDSRAMHAAVTARLDALSDRFSTWDPASAISGINRAATTDWQAIDAETCALIARALDLGRDTGGAFDITVAPLVDAWGFGPPEPGDLPNGERIRAMLAKTGENAIEVDCDRPALRKRWAEVSVDLSGIAKGYAADVVATLLERRGITRYLVEIGGEIRVRGVNGDNDAWRIAVENAEPGAAPVTVVAMTHGGFATSGDYRNFVEVDGRRYSHLIDPATGRPVDSGLAAVSVLAEDSATADALATALMAMGPDAARAFATRRQLAVIAQFRGGAEPLWTSPAMTAHVRQAGPGS